MSKTMDKQKCNVCAAHDYTEELVNIYKDARKAPPEQKLEAVRHLDSVTVYLRQMLDEAKVARKSIMQDIDAEQRLCQTPSSQ